jgi:methylated-DNA-protein-cysteine methyltransferase related protein
MAQLAASNTMGASRFMRGTVPTSTRLELHGIFMGDSSFLQLVASVVRAIPRGQTLSYAGVALRANKPGGARQVVKALNALRGLPWWRVIKSDGTIAKEMVSAQAPRLRREGLEVVGRRVRASSGVRKRAR